MGRGEGDEEERAALHTSPLSSDPNVEHRFKRAVGLALLHILEGGGSLDQIPTNLNRVLPARYLLFSATPFGKQNPTGPWRGAMTLTSHDTPADLLRASLRFLTTTELIVGAYDIQDMDEPWLAKGKDPKLTELNVHFKVVVPDIKEDKSPPKFPSATRFLAAQTGARVALTSLLPGIDPEPLLRGLFAKGTRVPRYMLVLGVPGSVECIGYETLKECFGTVALIPTASSSMLGVVDLLGGKAHRARSVNVKVKAFGMFPGMGRFSRVRSVSFSAL